MANSVAIGWKGATFLIPISYRQGADVQKKTVQLNQPIMGGTTHDLLGFGRMLDTDNVSPDLDNALLRDGEKWGSMVISGLHEDGAVLMFSVNDIRSIAASSEVVPENWTSG